MRSSTRSQEGRPANNSPITMPGDLLTPDQAAEILTLDVTTIYAKLRAGEIPYIDLAKRARRIRRADLEAFIESRLRGVSTVPTVEATEPAPAPDLAGYWSRPPAALGRQARKKAAR